MANMVITFNSACLFLLALLHLSGLYLGLLSKLKSLSFFKGWCGITRESWSTDDALEPEAAAIFCQEKHFSDFQAEVGSRPADGILSQINTHYVVVDIGGM